MLNKIALIVSISICFPAFAETFTTPPCLQKAIVFWEQIDSTYGKDQVVIHDSNTHEIFEVVNVKNLNKKNRNQKVNKVLSLWRDKFPTRELRTQTGIKERFQAGINRSFKYLPMILKIFKSHQLPRELALLPHVESSFDPRARSKVDARGMWQIMPDTAKMFSFFSKKALHDPEKSTELAAKILKSKFEYVGGHWPLAVTAYNHGQAGVVRAIQNVGSTDICEIIKYYEGSRFGFASKNFYAQFLTIQKLTNNYYKALPAWKKYY